MSKGLSFKDKWSAQQFANAEEAKGGVRAELKKEGTVWTVYLYDVMTDESIEGSPDIYTMITEIGEERQSNISSRREKAYQTREQREKEIKTAQEKAEQEAKKKVEERKKKIREFEKKGVKIAADELRDYTEEGKTAVKTMGRYGNVKKDLSRSVPTTSGKHPRILERYEKPRIASEPKPSVSGNVYPMKLGVPYLRRKRIDEEET